MQDRDVKVSKSNQSYMCNKMKDKISVSRHARFLQANRDLLEDLRKQSTNPNARSMQDFCGKICKIYGSKSRS